MIMITYSAAQIHVQVNYLYAVYECVFCMYAYGHTHIYAHIYMHVHMHVYVSLSGVSLRARH